LLNVLLYLNKVNDFSFTIKMIHLIVSDNQNNYFKKCKSKVNQDKILMLYPKLPLGGVTPTANIFLVNNQYTVSTLCISYQSNYSHRLNLYYLQTLKHRLNLD